MGGLSVGSSLVPRPHLLTRRRRARAGHDPIPISAPSLGPRLPIVLFFSAAPPSSDRACHHHTLTIRGPPRSSTKWLKERPQVSSKDVHYYCYSVAVNSRCSACSANVIIPNCLCFSVKLKFIGSHKENLIPHR